MLCHFCGRGVGRQSFFSVQPSAVLIFAPHFLPAVAGLGFGFVAARRWRRAFCAHFSLLLQGFDFDLVLDCGGLSARFGLRTCRKFGSGSDCGSLRLFFAPFFTRCGGFGIDI